MIKYSVIKKASLVHFNKVRPLRKLNKTSWTYSSAVASSSYLGLHQGFDHVLLELQLSVDRHSLTSLTVQNFALLLEKCDGLFFVEFLTLKRYVIRVVYNTMQFSALFLSPFLLSI